MSIKKISIVFEETGKNEGKHFAMYMEGDKERLLQNLPEEQLSPAEYWSVKAFKICAELMKKSGATKPPLKTGE